MNAREELVEEAVKALYVTRDNAVASSDAGWSTEDRRAAEAEAKRRFLEWGGSEDEGVQRFGAGSVSGFILGAEWWKATHPAHPEPQGEPSDAQVSAALDAWDDHDEDYGHVAMRAALRAAGSTP